METQEPNWRELFESAPCGLLSTSSDGTICSVNRTFCSWLGLEADALIGKKRFQELLTMGCRIFHQTHWLPLLQIQGSVAEVQLELVHAHGHALPMLVNALVRTRQAGVRHELAVFVASDRRKYERELLSARKQAEELLANVQSTQDALTLSLREREQDAQQRAVLAEQLVGIVSHDLRTPLNAIALGASLLAAGELPATQVRTVNRIHSAVGRATRLIGDLLDFTQARLGGGLRVVAREFDLHALADEAIEELRMTWPGRMVDHACVGDGTVSADPDRIAQALTNLANNALTYGTPDRPISITTRVAQQLTVEVHNFGPPIPADLMPHIFEPMRRGEQQVRLGSRSVGLGLYIVQEIATAHGGTVGVHSALDEGTTFSVTLPARRAAD